MAQVPSNGYTYSDQYSKVSIIWFKWLEQCHEEDTAKTQNIQHALNGGDFRVPNSHYKLDSWDPVRKHCYEFHSCLLHGCQTCYPKRRNSVRLPRTKQTANELFTLTQKKKTFLESFGYTYESMWYHEYVELQKNCTEFKDFVATCDIQAERLKPRDAFFGGRTNACKLHYTIKEGEHIKYVDFTSLYPYVNKYARYPVGHPKILNC
ncbi:uncharacterized protein LOC121377886 [Gigantopelta aegis]|uniref:uncharacterized protein LOC121377886 n=1 Tax=Gigantopelta aegis TaxID=1735272 RepID=UPI001B88C4A8|nr:uncharacterized protein LOC121377886 [Gigantopelta aegis]